MTDLQKSELREKLQTLATSALGEGLAAKFYSEDVLVVCLPLDEEKDQESEGQGAAPPGRPRGQGRDGQVEGTLL